MCVCACESPCKCTVMYWFFINLSGALARASYPQTENTHLARQIAVLFVLTGVFEEENMEWNIAPHTSSASGSDVLKWSTPLLIYYYTIDLPNSVFIWKPQVVLWMILCFKHVPPMTKLVSTHKSEISYGSNSCTQSLGYTWLFLYCPLHNLRWGIHTPWVHNVEV